MSTNQWKLIKFAACACAVFVLGWLFSIEKWETFHAGLFAFCVGEITLYLRSVCKKDDVDDDE